MKKRRLILLLWWVNLFRLQITKYNILIMVIGTRQKQSMDGTDMIHDLVFRYMTREVS